MKKLFSLILACFCIISFLNAQSEQMYKLTDPIPKDDKVKIGVLPNGLKYYIRKNAKPENRAELRLAVDAGSMQEDDDQLGLAHFVEHMAFNGTKNFKKNELVNYLESVGTRFGPDLNAYTSFDETVYMLQARTDSLALLEKGLLILQDWANGLSFDPEEIDKERGVIISEWRTGLSADQRMQQKYFPILYQGARYAKRLPIGDTAIIENADYATLERFYKDWYRPELMAVVAVGDFEVDWMEQQIIERFGAIAKSEKLREKASEHVPRHKETLFAICSDKEAAFTRAQVIFKQPRAKAETIADIKGSFARRLYNSMLGARLFELQQQANPPFTFATTGYSRDIGDIDSYFVYAFVGEGQVKEGLGAVLLETKRALLHGFTQTELDREKTKLLKAAERRFKESDKQNSSGLTGPYISNHLRGSSYANAEQWYAMTKQLLPLVTLDDINPLAKEWITPENRVVIVTGPENEDTPLPDEAMMRTILKEFDEATPEPYEDNVSDEPLLEDKLNAKPILSEKVYESIGVTEITLSNGVKIALKPTDFKNDEIRMNSFSPGGHSLYSDEEYHSAASADLLVDFGGISNFSLTELQKKLAGKVVSISPYISEIYEGYSGSCSPEDLETMLQLTYLYATKPRKDETAIQSYISRQKSIYKNILTNPYYYFAEQMTKVKYANHLRRGLPAVSDLEAISLDRSFEIYAERFQDASDFTFVFVGNFEVEKIKPLLATYLGNLPSTNRKESWKDVKADLVKGKTQKIIKRGQAPKAVVDITYHGDFEYTGQNRYDFYSMIALLRIKMRESMREDKGGVYGVRLSGTAAQFPKKRFSINLSFNCEPDKVENLIATAMNDIENLKTNGAEEKDIQKVQETQRQNKIKNLKENSYWLGQLSTRYKEGIDIEGITVDKYESFVEQLNSEALQKAAQNYFTGENRIEMVLLPEAEAKKNEK